MTGSTFNFWLGQFFGSLSPDLSPLLSLNIIELVYQLSHDGRYEEK